MIKKIPKYLTNSNTIRHIQARLSRAYKYLKPRVKVFSGTSLIGKETNFVIDSAMKEKKKFFKARIYNYSELLQKTWSASDTELKENELRELNETLPLLLIHIKWSGERWYIGKIDNHPFDIFMAPKRFVNTSKKQANIFQGLHIQTKRLTVYPPRKMGIDEWFNFFQRMIIEKIILVDYGFSGHIHFYNEIEFTKSVSWKKLKSKLKKLHVPHNRWIESISLSMPLTHIKTNKTTTATLMIYPSVSKILGKLDSDMIIAKKIYDSLPAEE